MSLSIASLAAMERLGLALADVVESDDVITLSGPLGAGKTTLARAILAGLGYTGEVPSPSFAILQYYDLPDVRLPVVHADFYRLERGGDLAELGLDDASDGLIIAEWPERIGGMSGPRTLELQIDPSDGSGRMIGANAGRSWQARWAAVADRISSET